MPPFSLNDSANKKRFPSAWKLTGTGKPRGRI
jgi:hypothetical protein